MRVGVGCVRKEDFGEHHTPAVNKGFQKQMWATPLRGGTEPGSWQTVRVGEVVSQ